MGFAGTGEDMVRQCEEETGVRLVYREPEQEEGIEREGIEIISD